MAAVAIGILSGLLTILLVLIFKLIDKKTAYGLILSGIGFLYVGYVWTDLQSLIINSIQAIVFLLLGYYGIKKSIYILAIGYFLHGCWDLTYTFFREASLIPPHYDLFCSSLDFIIGIYILVFRHQFLNKKIIA
jgi:hypothetical protein